MCEPQVSHFVIPESSKKLFSMAALSNNDWLGESKLMTNRHVSPKGHILTFLDKTNNHFP